MLYRWLQQAGSCSKCQIHSSSLGWEEWCRGKLKVIVTPGDHEAILFGPRLPIVAGILQACLDSA
jgi:thioesterase domain-containing protein